MLVNRIWNGCRLNKRCELVPHCAKRDGNFWRMEGLPLVGNSRFLPGSRVISVAGFENPLEIDATFGAAVCARTWSKFLSKADKGRFEKESTAAILALERGKICARRARVVITVVLRVRAIRT